MIITKPEEKILYCEACETWTPQGLIRSIGQYICKFDVATTPSAGVSDVERWRGSIRKYEPLLLKGKGL